MYDKKYFEKYAILSLAWYVDSRLDIILLDDKNYESPDFQSELLDIGIEVVQTITAKEGEENFIVNKYFGKGLKAKDIIEKAEDRFGSKIKGKISNFHGIAVYSHSKRLVNFNIHLKLINEKVRQKTQKLNDNYKRFRENWLYIFSHESHINEYDIKTVCGNWFNFEGNSFNVIIINCIDTIYVVSNKEIKSFELNNEELKKLKKEASK